MTKSQRSLWAGALGTIVLALSYTSTQGTRTFVICALAFVLPVLLLTIWQSMRLRARSAAD